MRDCFIKRMLILHTKDVNATVRSKVYCTIDLFKEFKSDN